MALVFNPPPNWPKPPAGWSPTPTWRPDPAWGPVPEGWQLWIEEPEPENEQASSTAESSSTDRSEARPRAPHGDRGLAFPSAPQCHSVHVR